MLASVGQFLLILSLVTSAALMLLPMVGYFKNNQALMQTGRPLSYLLFVLVLTTFLILVSLFMLQDFSVTYVWQNSSLALPLRYRITATWGAHEGSVLMWVAVQALWIAAVSRYSRSLTLSQISRVLSVLGIIATGFLAFVLFASNPFEITNPAPLDGRDLNPLLQDFGMIIHPPLLYFGYVGLSVAFALAVAALIGGQIDEKWIRWSRRWTNLAWAFLTVGIILGSWWAYYELGWGGWWFWDPVENASFLPWLAGTALIHVQAVSERKNAFRGWTVMLAIIAFSLCVLGTFLVRSGSITSVHSFAADPFRGLFILVLLAIYTGGALTLYALRVNQLRSRDAINLESRETLMLANSVIFITATFTILLGTLFPMIFDYFNMKISVGEPYFGLMFFLLMIPMAVLLPLGAQLKWHRDQMHTAIKALLPHFLVASVLTIACYVGFGGLNLRATAGVFGGFWIASATLWQLKQTPGQLNAGLVGMTTAHMGVAVFLFAMSMTEHKDIEKDVLLKPGQTTQVAGYDFLFNGVQRVAIENYQAQQGTIVVSKNGEEIVTLHPQKRFYPKQQMPMTEADIRAGVLKDIYVSLGEQINDQGAWSVRIYLKPFIRWMWFGGLMMMAGAVIALFSRRSRRMERQQADQVMQDRLGLT
ncbi:heme lyase CcmF/NrfE family subunit [Marinicella meishanensis]|uniref:heme lyase CcmF/NrfE family subunit n=1 Tax=Marinicella meishanensis TaxID=2873263 RepID=UPI001CBFAF43|nr:heme lyase CcmF/NrfE family subunit [Marinicella sp. NBU2979]